MSYHLICSADFHQGSEFFPISSRGKQCVANCMVFLMMSKLRDVESFSKSDLHFILYAGDYIYRDVQSKQISNYAYLLPSELPQFIFLKGNVVKFTLSKTYSGTLDEQFVGEYPLLPLKSAVHNMLLVSRNLEAFAILIVNCNAVGIYFNMDTFSVFDPHARNVMGLCGACGTCVLGSVKSVDDLCMYLRALCKSLSSLKLSSLQYDLHIIKIHISQENARKFGSEKNLTIIPSVTELKLGYEKSITPDASHNLFTQLSGHINSNTKKRQNCEQLRIKAKKVKSCNFKVETTVEKVLPTRSMLCQTTKHYETIKLVDLPFFTENHNSSKKQKNMSKFPVESKKKALCLAEPEGHSERSVTDSVLNMDIQEINEAETNEVFAIEKLLKKFKSKVSQGPEYVCSSCSQTFFKHSVVNIDAINVSDANPDNFIHKCLTGIKSVNNYEWVCVTCLQSIKLKKIPACSHANNLKFPLKPPELDLTPLEERLVAPRLPFMQIREMPRGGQLNLHGNVVNVPANVNSTVRVLPRLLNDTETIPVKFKRKLSFKHHVAFENIRPTKVLNAAKWLIENSILFRNEGITIDETWLHNNHSQTDEGSDSDENESLETQRQKKGHDQHASDSDKWTENDEFEERPNGNLDTVLQPMDYREFNQILALAPREGNSPLGLYQDINAEFLSFPTIYCGQSRYDNNCRPVPLHYSTICKWELRNVDRRAATSVPSIFFKLKKLQIKQIKDKVSVAIRKCKTHGRRLTANEILAPGAIDELTKHDDGYKVLRTLRGSPPYWEQAKKDLFAMIKQLGIPTWFCSFSAAETKWIPLLKCLWKLVKKTEATTEEIEKMSIDKSRPSYMCKIF